MKLSTLVLTTVLTLSTATAAQAKPIRVFKSWGNLQHKVRHHQNHQRHQNHQQTRHHQPSRHQPHQRVNHHNRRQHHQARPHRPTHHSAYPYYQRQIRY